MNTRFLDKNLIESLSYTAKGYIRTYNFELSLDWSRIKHFIVYELSHGIHMVMWQGPVHIVASKKTLCVKIPKQLANRRFSRINFIDSQSNVIEKLTFGGDQNIINIACSTYIKDFILDIVLF